MWVLLPNYKAKLQQRVHAPMSQHFRQVATSICTGSANTELRDRLLGVGSLLLSKADHCSSGLRIRAALGVEWNSG